MNGSLARQNGWRRKANEQNRMYWIAIAILAELTADHASWEARGDMVVNLSTWQDWHEWKKGNLTSCVESISGLIDGKHHNDDAYVGASIYAALWHKDRTSVSTIL